MDIAKRLNDLADLNQGHPVGDLSNGLEEAANEIERLRAENEALREALEMLLRYIETGDMRKVDLRVARQALAAHDKEGK